MVEDARAVVRPRIVAVHESGRTVAFRIGPEKMRLKSGASAQLLRWYGRQEQFVGHMTTAIALAASVS
jgi:hypothetical protein